MPVVIVTGIPGTGKTTISKRIAKLHSLKYIDVNKVITENKLSEGYDKKRNSEIIDVKKLNKELIKEIQKEKKKVVIDSHISHYLAKKHVNLCIVTKCDLKELEKRLRKRKYKEEKIRENLDSEIFDVCLVEATESKHNVVVLDTTKRVTDKVLKGLL